MKYRRAWLMRFSSTDDQWSLKDTSTGLFVLVNKAKNWCIDVRSALNNTGAPSYRARNLAQAWLRHCEQLEKAEEAQNDKTI